MINEEGYPVTANVIGIEYNNKIYNVPSYNREGDFYSEDQAREVFKKDIEAGKIQGYEKTFEGPIEKHPANVAARLEHEMMAIDGDNINPSSVAFDKRQGFESGGVSGKIINTLQKIVNKVSGNVVEVQDTGEDYGEIVLQRAYERLKKEDFKKEVPLFQEVPYETFKKNAIILADNTREAESNNQNLKRGENILGSSASGFYQMLEGSVPTAVNRGKKFFGDSNIFDEVIKMNDSSLASKGVQDALFFSNIFESKGSDAQLGPALFLGDKNASMNAYLYNHHTLSSKVDKYNDNTIKRAEGIWEVPYQEPYQEPYTEFSEL